MDLDIPETASRSCLLLHHRRSPDSRFFHTHIPFFRRTRPGRHLLLPFRFHGCIRRPSGLGRRFLQLDFRRRRLDFRDGRLDNRRFRLDLCGIRRCGRDGDGFFPIVSQRRARRHDIFRVVFPGCRCKKHGHDRRAFRNLGQADLDITVCPESRSGRWPGRRFRRLSPCLPGLLRWNSGVGECSVRDSGVWGRSVWDCGALFVPHGKGPQAFTEPTPSLQAAGKHGGRFRINLRQPRQDGLLEFPGLRLLLRLHLRIRRNQEGGQLFLRIRSDCIEKRVRFLFQDLRQEPGRIERSASVRPRRHPGFRKFLKASGRWP